MKLPDNQTIERQRARIKALTNRVIRLEECVANLSKYGLFDQEEPFQPTSKEEWRDLINTNDSYHVPTRTEIEEGD